jgi:hypothetical protein
VRTALGYVRASTDEQAERGLGLEAQRQRIRAYCEMKGLHLTTFFEDPGLSGGKPLGSRSAGGRLLADARRTKPVVVVANGRDAIVPSPGPDVGEPMDATPCPYCGWQPTILRIGKDVVSPAAKTSLFRAKAERRRRGKA